MTTTGPQPLLAALLDVLRRRGERAWLVGGSVRDRELGRLSPDMDVVVQGDARALAAEVAAASATSWFPLSHDFGAYRVVAGDGHLDVAGLRGGSLEADLAQRDFTVNALALPVEGGELIDLYGGRGHLEQRRLVAVAPTVFSDDPLRLLRAARFVHVLGFRADPGLDRLIQGEAWRLPSVAAERILSEVSLTLEAGRSAAAFCLWGDFGLLEVLFPEVGRLRGLEQSGYHHLDAYHHTLDAAARLDEILELPGRWFSGSWETLSARLAQPVDGVVSRPVALRLAALLHDIAKPDTRTVDERGKILFWGHTELGARQAAGVCRRLHCSTDLTRLISTIIREHLSLGVLERRNPPSPRDVVSYLWRTAPWEPEALLLSLADRLATRGSLVNGDHVRAQVSLAERLMAEWARRSAVWPLRPPVDGNLLMAELGLHPGPLLGEVLREVTLAFEAGEATTPEKALDVARRYLARRRGIEPESPGG